MHFPVQEKQGFSVIALSGDVDMNHSPHARKAILSCLKKMQHVMVDLSSVDYIDSSGVASLVEGFQYARSNNLEFGLLSVSDTAMSILKLARLDKVFQIYPSLEARLENGR
jgi:anti-sigma B factor antagonist